MTELFLALAFTLALVLFFGSFRTEAKRQLALLVAWILLLLPSVLYPIGRLLFP